MKAKSEDEREDAARDLFADVSPEREEAFLEVMGRLKKEEDQAVVIRTAGRAEMKAWAPTLVQMLDAKQAWIRNCTVVTLEEEGDPVVAPQLLALW